MNTEELMQLVTRFNNVRDERLDLQRKRDKRYESEIELKLMLVAAIKESGLQKVANVKLVLKIKPVAKDWEAIRKYIIEHDAWDLMQRRLGDLACRERWDDGIDLPGIDKFPVDDLSIGKRVDS